MAAGKQIVIGRRTVMLANAKRNVTLASFSGIFADNDGVSVSNSELCADCAVASVFFARFL